VSEVLKVTPITGLDEMDVPVIYDDTHRSCRTLLMQR
jgi:hypothetical protein